MATNKVIYSNQTLIDLTADTVTPDKMLSGYIAHDKGGEVIEGTCSYDVNSQDATAAVAEILTGKTAYVRGSKLTGTMPNNGSVTGTISAKADEYSVPIGFHDGSGKVGIVSTEQAKIIPGNIKQGISILGVTGSLEPSSDVTVQAKTATPSTSEQVILPDAEYDYLSQVTVAAIPFTESPNSAGGMTVTIAG